MGESGPIGSARPPFDGLIRGRFTLVLVAVGQFRTAGGLDLLSGRTLGPQMSCRSRCLVKLLMVVAELLLGSERINNSPRV
jgi:hypothetical protein